MATAALIVALSAAGMSSATAASPTEPVITYPTDGGSANKSQPTFRGTMEAPVVLGTTLAFVIDGEPAIGPAQYFNDNGVWSFVAPDPLADGTHHVSVTVTTPDGQAKTSPTHTFIVDTVAPSRPVVTNPANGTIVFEPTVTFTGTAEANTHVMLDNTTWPDRVPVDASGNWSHTFPTSFANGDHTFTVRSQDAAGNVSLSRTITITVDAPPAPEEPTTPEPTEPTEAPADPEPTEPTQPIADEPAAPAADTPVTDDATAPGANTQQPVAESDALAVTGANTVWTLAGATLLIALGSALFLTRRRTS